MASERYVIVKRDLFYRPNSQGYTGIKDEAGVFSAEDLLVHVQHKTPQHNSYRPGEKDIYILPFDAAPDFTASTYHDLCSSHLAKVKAENTRLREALQPFAKAADCLDEKWRDYETHWSPQVKAEITVGDLRRAREALKEQQ